MVGLLIAAFCSVIAGGKVFGEGLSLQVVKMPLKSVLNDLSQKSGTKFVYDKAWADLPITAQFKNIALEPALKRILSNLNYAIIYGTDGTVMIRIYGTIAYENDSSMGSGRARSFSEQNAADRLEELNPQEALGGADAVEEISEPTENAEEVSEPGETPEENPESDEIRKEGTPEPDETGQEDQPPPAEEDTEGGG